MAAATTQSPEVLKSPQEAGSLAMIGTLGGIALVSGLLLALVYQGTDAAILRNNQARTSAAVMDILPGAVSQKVFVVSVPGRGGETVAQNVYAGYDASGALVGVALGASDSGGYGGEIRLIYGYLPDKEQVAGMKVLLSKETPGLGDRIKTDPAFQSNFDGLDVSLDPATNKPKNPVAYAKPGAEKDAWQVEGISGATISSQAVARAMRNSTNTLLPIVHDMLDELKKGGK